MENQYGIATTNKYSLFLDDEDVDLTDILKAQEEAKKAEEKGKGKKDARSEKDSKSAKNKQNKKVLAPVQEQKGRQIDPNISNKEDKPERQRNRRQGDQSGDKPNRPPRDRENRGEVPPRRERRDRENRVDRPQTGEGGFRDRDAERGEDRGEFRGRGRGRGGRGGGRGRGGFDRFGKREFERHSGSDKSGVKAVDKREGSGSHNWGNFKDDIDQQLNDTNVSEENPADWSAQMEEGADPAKDGDAKPATDTEMPESPVELEDPEPQEMTLDEWKAQQKNAHKDMSFNIRRPGEGCDDSQWKKMYVLKKKETGESEEEEEEEYEERPARRANQLDIQITFNDTNRMRGGRGGRGGGRGRDDRGGGRGRGRGGDREGSGRGGFRGDRDREPRDRDSGSARGEGRGGFRNDREPRESGSGRGESRGGFGDRGGGRGGFRGDRDRGDRGGDRGGFRGRGGRGRGSPRGGGGGENSDRRREPAPNVIDESEFPSLVKSSA